MRIPGRSRVSRCAVHIAVVVTVSVLSGCAPSWAAISPRTAPSGPTTGNVATPARIEADPRPFASDSAWNLPIPDRPVLDPRSAAMVGHLASQDRGFANLYAYGTPVFEADASTPRHRVRCTASWGACGLEDRPVPIPADAAPSPGSDGSMVVIDRATRTVYDFWQARRIPGGWETSWGTANPLDGYGNDNGGAIGAGISALAGLVRTSEIRTGQIDHALVFSTDNACTTSYRYPATQTDGQSSAPDCIPEGARIQLDPLIDIEAIPGITPAERAVAKALQIYGAYCRDNGAAPMAFAFENPITTADPHPEAGLRWDYYGMPHIPWKRLRVLSNWTGR